MKSFWGSSGGITLSIGIVDMGVFVFQYFSQLFKYFDDKMVRRQNEIRNERNEQAMAIFEIEI